MTIFRSEVGEKHGGAVLFTRLAIKAFSVASTRSPLFGGSRLVASFTDWMVLGFTAATLAIALLAAQISSVWLLTALAIFAAWRIYDISCNHFHILIVDRSELADQGYKSSIRAFVLAGYNLVEIACAMFVIERYLLWAKWTDCLFGTTVAYSNYKPGAAFVSELYALTSLASIDASCAGQSWPALLFAIGSTVAICMLVLVVIARAISSIPFIDRSKA